MSFDEKAPIMCKITDFGESKAIGTTAAGRENLANPIWLAPEVMKGGEYSEKCDVFAFGIIMWELLTGLIPYDEFDVSRGQFTYRFEDAIVNGLRPTIPPRTPESYERLVVSSWDADTMKRPSASELCSLIERMKSDVSSWPKDFVVPKPPPTDDKVSNNKNKNKKNRPEPPKGPKPAALSHPPPVTPEIKTDSRSNLSVSEKRALFEHT